MVFLVLWNYSNSLYPCKLGYRIWETRNDNNWFHYIPITVYDLNVDLLWWILSVINMLWLYVPLWCLIIIIMHNNLNIYCFNSPEHVSLSIYICSCIYPIASDFIFLTQKWRQLFKTELSMFNHSFGTFLNPTGYRFKT